MKNILITQRISLSDKNILQTKLDLDWYDYASKLKFNLIPLGYKINLSNFKKIKFDGIIFSGGNSLSKYEKKKENMIRDKFEINLFNYFEKRNLPILAVCRGMQLIASINKAKLLKTKNHIKKGHDITLNNNRIINVNSYHTYLIKRIPNQFRILAQHTKDKSIEAMTHNTKKILCVMFHPERKSKDQTKVNQLIKEFFKI